MLVKTENTDDGNCIRDMFGDPDFRPFAPELQKRLCHPNRLYMGTKNGDKIGVLVAGHSNPDADWAVGKAGIDYLLNAKREGRIAAGYVGLADGATVVAAVPVQELADKLAAETPRTGMWGLYWWMNRSFGSANGGRYVNEDEAF